MGISGFLNYLKKTYLPRHKSKIFSRGQAQQGRPRQQERPPQPENIWLLNYNYSIGKKYDYLFLDYQSMFYTTYELFSSEINYFLRLIYYIKYEARINNRNILSEKSPSYEDILNYIIKKYTVYFNRVSENFQTLLPNIRDSIQIIIEKIDRILTLNFNNKDIIIYSLTFYIVEQTDNLSNDVIKDQYAADEEGKKKRTYIFFDGIPSLSKIKEQNGRRINGLVMNNILNSIWESDMEVREFSLKFINSKLLSSLPPSIGLNSEIVLEVKRLLNKNYFINSIDHVNKFGEAEHQIMKYINDNSQLFNDSDILISSPDADLILLIFIKATNNYRIDLLRQNVITELKINVSFEYVLSGSNIISPYCREYDHIIIDHLISAIGLKLPDGSINNQFIVDISFLFLLLGDDFIPIIPTMDVYKIQDLLFLYKDLNSRISNFKIINIGTPNKINFINLKIFINVLSLNEHKWKPFIMDPKKNYDQGRENLEIIKTIYFINRMNFSELDIHNFEKSYFFKDKGIFINSRNEYDNSLLTTNKPSLMNNEKIQNYLQGYSFILDIYFNDTLKNYKWIYNHEKAPTLVEINKFLEDKNDECVLREIFDYTKKNNDNYLNSETYLEFTNDNKTQIIINLLDKIIVVKRNFGDLGKLHKASSDKKILDELCKKYFIYDEQTFHNLFNCNGAKYINKCVDIENYLPIPLSSKYERPMDKLLLGGYYQKYLKYKNKYLSLKNKL